MSNQLIMREHAARAGMGTVLYTSPTGVKFTTEMKAQGYTMDEQGNIYWPGGQFMSGPTAYGVERPRTVAAAAVPQVYLLPNGQRATMTPEQYAQYLAAAQVNPNAAAPGSQISAGLGAGFDSLSKQFGVSSTTMILLAVAGFYLLMKPPPERKR
jgi:hypothetical protein